MRQRHSQFQDPPGAGKLILIFLMRTAIAIPLVALLTNLIY